MPAVNGDQIVAVGGRSPEVLLSGSQIHDRYILAYDTVKDFLHEQEQGA
jgi:hypothetical protein